MASDLISREALLADLRESKTELERILDSLSCEMEWRICEGQVSSWAEVIMRVQQAPAVDAEPVRWTSIPNFEGLYEISTLAQVRNAKGEVLKQQIRREKYTCYKTVSLWKNGRYFNKGVHRLMAEAFIPNPDNLPVVNHKDEDGTNNLLSNLEWCDRSYNASYGSSPKKLSKAFKGRISEKRIPVQQLKDGVVIKEYACAGEAEKETGIAMGNIRLACRGVRKRAGGFEWRYGAKMDGGKYDKP